MVVQPQQRDDGVAEGGQILWGVAFAYPAGIFVERHVADMVRTVFNSPMTALPGGQSSRVGLIARHAGNRVLDFDGLLAVALVLASPRV